MPKLGAEPIRRDALLKATIAEIGARGAAEVTVARIARRAGMSTALAHHYGGAKDAMFLSAFRQILRDYGASVRAALAGRTDPRARTEAVIRAGFGPGNFRGDVAAAWLDLYVVARTDPGAARLLRLYRARLNSNLVHALRPLAAGDAPSIAATMAALIDGLYLHAVTSGPDDDLADRAVAAMDALLRAR